MAQFGIILECAKALCAVCVLIPATKLIRIIIGVNYMRPFICVLKIKFNMNPIRI